MKIELVNIDFKYPKSEKYLFKNLSCKIERPGFHALFGPSGVGKTSFAKILSEDIKNHKGKIIKSGIEKMAYSYNLERLPGWSTIGKHLSKIIPEKYKKLKDELIITFGLEKCMDQRFSALSLGQKNRINLLRYLLQGFNMLILDESLANVDEKTREKIILKIKKLFPDMFFFYISHNIIEVSRFCRDILVLRGAHKSPQAVLLKGLDLTEGQKPGKDALELTMLEIMNAS